MVQVTETPAAVIQAAVERKTRTKASPEKVARQKRSREVAKLLKLAKEEEAGSSVKARMAAVVRRMVRRYVPVERHGEALLHSYDYWSLRRIYDVYSDEGRVEQGGRWTGRWLDEGKSVKELIAPEATRLWQWWMALHWKTRLITAGVSTYILKGREPAQAFTIQNPAFEIIHGNTGEDFLTQGGDAA